MKDINIQGLSKSYLKGQIKALDSLNLSVDKGELFGLIGPDGAGKTTLFRLLTTLLLPDSGQASVLGYDIVADYQYIRSKVGYMPGSFSLYQDLTVEENLHFFASIFNTTVKANYDLIKDIYIQIEPFKTRRAGQLSGGMKQKLALCCALIHRPEVLFLDEPTTGVDTVSRKEFWEMLKKLKQEGITILVSTPYMDEANLCERIALIQKGEILSINTPEQIISNYPQQLYAIRSNHMSKLLADLRQHKLIKSVYSFGDMHHITFHQAPTLSGQFAFTTSLGHSDIMFKPIVPTVEDCFIQLMTKIKEHE